MSQSVTENLFNHDVSITVPDGLELTVDLSAAPWNRTTIADGWWLQNRTNSAFSARDIYLANCIDKVNDDISDIRGGYINSLISMNNVIYSANDYWDGLPPTIAPSNTSKPAPSNTLTYMTVGEDTDLGTEDISLINDRTCIIQGNFTENSFNQILMNTNGLFYRSVSGDTVNSVTGEKIYNYDLLETDTKFSQILDDSTINAPGYWFLHKETSGRPVWTNINALAEYIDNRVNPDEVYIGWSATNILGYDTRILTLFPPTENNINSSIDVTDVTYTNNAYLWSDGGWVECPPLMSRTEIEEIIFSGGNLPPFDESNAGQVLTVTNEGDGLEWTDKGGGGEASLKDFLSLFTANGAQAHYSNDGGTMRSECSEDGYYYFTSGNTAFRTSAGKPRENIFYGGLGIDDYDIEIENTETTTTSYLDVTGRIPFIHSGTVNDLSATYPMFIELAPFSFTESNINIPRTWDIHFCIKGLGKFNDKYTTGGIFEGTYAALADVSIIWCTGVPSVYTQNYEYDTSKTYYITRGDYIASEAVFSSIDALPSNTASYLQSCTSNSFIEKDINYHQVISAGQINDSAYKPYLRICLKGLEPKYYTEEHKETLALCLQNTLTGFSSNPVTLTPNKRFQFIEEFTDDRFMDMAYRYVNNLPTRRLSYTNGSEDNLLGVNTANPTLTTNTHVLGA